MTYHEKVAKRMSESMSVGPFVQYDRILAALRAKWRTEDELRAHVKRLEENAQLLGAPPGWKLIDE